MLQGGGPGIRTQKSLRTAVFKTAAIAILPTLPSGASYWRRVAYSTGSALASALASALVERMGGASLAGMRDLSIQLENRPGALAEMGEALGRAGVSVEGGGAWVADRRGTAHFLFADGAAARRALEAAGIRVVDDREVVITRLDQARPGQLGALTRMMADAGVNIEVLYSDHDHQLILVVEDIERGRAVAASYVAGEH